MEGLAGAVVGIEYVTLQDSPGFRILEWNSCGLTFSTDDWPQSGSGAILTTNTGSNLGECPQSELSVLGYFWVQVDGPGALRFIGYPKAGSQYTGQILVGTCPGSSYEQLPETRAGWVSMGGAAIGLDNDGCNPMLEPCNPGIVLARPTTWGKIKVRYLH